jgi:hypothetical protein
MVMAMAVILCRWVSGFEKALPLQSDSLSHRGMVRMLVQGEAHLAGYVARWSPCYVLTLARRCDPQMHRSMVGSICLVREVALDSRSALCRRRTFEGLVLASDLRTSRLLRRPVHCGESVLRTCVRGSVELRGGTSKAGKRCRI